MLLQIGGIISGVLPVPVSYDDGDQSPLAGEEAQFLRNKWANGMDYHPYDQEFVYLSDWLKESINMLSVSNFYIHTGGLLTGLITMPLLQ